MINLQNAVQFLLENGFMAVVKGKYMVTAKFNKEILGVTKGLTMLPGNIPAVIEPDIPKKITWQEMYQRFIIESKVPARILSPRGTPYQTNAYSEDGMKAFRKAVEKEGMKYDLLVEATQLYYTSSIELKVAIGRFMEEGIWRTYYQELIDHKAAGTLSDHVKSNKDESSTRWRIG